LKGFLGVGLLGSSDLGMFWVIYLFKVLDFGRVLGFWRVLGLLGLKGFVGSAQGL
jgi:hypothetical protein